MDLLAILPLLPLLIAPRYPWISRYIYGCLSSTMGRYSLNTIRLRPVDLCQAGRRMNRNVDGVNTNFGTGIGSMLADNSTTIYSSLFGPGVLQVLRRIIGSASSTPTSSSSSPPQLCSAVVPSCESPAGTEAQVQLTADVMTDHGGED